MTGMNRLPTGAQLEGGVPVGQGTHNDESCQAQLMYSQESRALIPLLKFSTGRLVPLGPRARDDRPVKVAECQRVKSGNH